MQQQVKTLGSSSESLTPRRRWWHSFWLWVTVALVVVVLALATHSAAA